MAGVPEVAPAGLGGRVPVFSLYWSRVCCLFRLASHEESCFSLPGAGLTGGRRPGHLSRSCLTATVILDLWLAVAL